GNLCRCTGYRPIMHGVRTLACDHEPHDGCTQRCEPDPSFAIRRRGGLARIRLDELPPPGERQALHFSGGGREWYRPVTLEEVRRLKAQCVRQAGRERVKLVFGNTAAGVYQNEAPSHFIDISAIPELAEVAEDDSGIRIGAAVTIQRLID